MNQNPRNVKGHSKENVVRTAKTKPGTEILAIRIPEDLKKALSDLRWEKRRTITEIVVPILRRAVKRMRKAAA